MLADVKLQLNVGTVVKPMVDYLRRPVKLLRGYKAADIRPDLIAGITVAVIMLPQAIAFAVIAELPPQMGLYAAIMGSFFGALWGSSNHVHTGPANAISLLVLSSLSSTGITDPGQLVIAASFLALMVGVFQVLMGMARLGVLINFVSHSVVVGFSTGAGALIAIKQFSPLIGISFPSDNILQAITGSILHLPDFHPVTTALGVGTILMVVLLRRISSRMPNALMSMILASVLVAVLKLDQAGVEVIGQLPNTFPPVAALPWFDLELIGRLSVGALAVGSISLVQTIAIARSVSSQTGQRLSSDQEFVGQGIGNIAAGIFSGFPVAASFSRSAVNYESGARTPMASVFSSIFVLVAMLTLGRFAAFLPRAALAGVLITIAVGIADREEIKRIWQGTRGDSVIMLVTFLGTIFLKIEFAVLVGIMFSFARYIMRTSAPRVQSVLPDENYKHFTYQPDRAPCPQMSVTEVLGDLYFGAVNHVEETLLEQAEVRPDQRFLLIRLHHVNHCDFSGIHMLESVVRSHRDRGGDVFLVGVSDTVRKVMTSTGFDAFLGESNMLSEDGCISHIFYRVLDPTVCIYECPVRVFMECQNLPKREAVLDIPANEDIPDDRVFQVSPEKLWQLMHPVAPEKMPYIIDVREPREFRRGHIPEAHSVPLPKIMGADVTFPNDRKIVLVCRTGRRSRRAAYALQRIGCMNTAIVSGGMVAWESSDLLQALGDEERLSQKR